MSPEVAAALAAGRAVVALESTIISHGMPYPQNLATARAVEGVVRGAGAVPATIAVLGGVPHVGLTPPQLERLARAGSAVRKVSRRDLPLVIALGLDGATTVSATMLLAARAGIAVFVTGGELGRGGGGLGRVAWGELEGISSWSWTCRCLECLRGMAACSSPRSSCSRLLSLFQTPQRRRVATHTDPTHACRHRRRAPRRRGDTRHLS